MADFLTMMAAEEVPERQARELAAGLTAQELRMLMAAQSEAESDHKLEQRLAQARSDPRLLAAALPRGRSAPVFFAVFCLFCVGMLGWAVVMSFQADGPVVGLLINLGAIIAYLAVRPLAKRTGWLSVGVFTVSRDGVWRVLSGIGQARRRVQFGGGDLSRGRNFGVAVVFLLVVLGVPTTVAIVADLPEIILGWMVMAMLALNEMVLLVIRTRVDARRRAATVVDGQFGLSMTADYLNRGGDTRRLLAGIKLDELVPPTKGAFTTVMRDAILRRELVRAQRPD